MYHKLVSSDKNAFFSPYSIYAALGMVYAGSRGETSNQMQKVLRQAEKQDMHQGIADMDKVLGKLQGDGSIELAVANSIWPDSGHKFLATYLTLLKNKYGVLIEPVNYKVDVDRNEAVKKINDWVEKKTRDKIKTPVSPDMLDSSTRMVLVNAIYFKGSWQTKFEKTATQKMLFHKIDGTDKQTDFMNRRGTFGYADVEDAQVLEIPYKGDTTSMIIVLPHATSNINKLESQLSTTSFNSWISSLRTREVVVTIPKYKMDYSASLNDPLGSMGMTLAFNKEWADFSGMDGCKSGKCGDWLYLSQGIHKAFIAVDEEGTEAAAVTVFEDRMVTTSVNHGPPVFSAERPFYFLSEKRAPARYCSWGDLSRRNSAFVGSCLHCNDIVSVTAR